MDIENKIKKIKKLISNKNIKVVSFDVYDTMIVRYGIKPTDILKLARLDESKDTGGIDLLEARIKAEKGLKKYHNLNDIWDKIGENLKLSNDIKLECINKELNAETEFTCARLFIKEIYDYACSCNKKIIAISDMYLSSEFIGNILKRNGYGNVSHVYVSNEVGFEKKDASLFIHVLKKEKIKPQEMIHIGDNLSSDFKKPKKIGIKSIYFPSNLNILTKGYGLKYCVNNLYSTEDINLRIIYGYILSCKEKELSCHDIDDNKLAILFLMPILISISLFISNNECIKNYDSIYFASRDGYLPIKSYELFIKYLNKQGYKYKYIFSSRRFYQYTQYRTPVDEYMFYEKKNNLKNHDFLQLIIFDKKIYENIVSKYENIDDLDKKSFLEFLKNNEEINRFYLKQKSLVKKYYTNIFGKENHRALVFDCGYNGSISKGIGGALEGKILIDKLYMWQSLENYNNDNLVGTKTFVVLPRNVKNHDDLLMELLLSECSGSYIGLKDNLFPVFDVIPKSQLDSNIEIKRIQNLSLIYFEDFCSIFKDYLANLKIDDVKCMSNLIFDFIHNTYYKNSGVLNKFIFNDPLIKKYECTFADILSLDKTFLRRVIRYFLIKYRKLLK